MEENQLIVIEAERKSLLENVNEITINNEEENQEAGTFLKQIKPIIKQIKEYWKPLKESAKKAHSELCAKEKEMLQPLEEAETKIKAKMSLYIMEQEEKAKREQEALRKAQSDEALKQLEEAERLKAEGKELEAQIQEEMAYVMDEVKTVVEPTIKKQEGISYMTDYEVEIAAIVDKHGVHPIHNEGLPKPIMAHLLRDRIASVEMELEAFEKHSREYLTDLVMMDPWTKSREQAEKLIDDIFALPCNSEMKEYYK